jgi:prevent-host-death family protein
MKRISIQGLKAQLSATVAEAESGDTIVITRHNQPVAKLCPADPTLVHWGRRVGTTALKPAAMVATTERYLEVLRDDRGGR